MEQAPLSELHGGGRWDARTHHERSHGVYGAPRIRADLRETDGLQVDRRRVARLMRAAGLVGAPPPAGRP
jgi:transposase InsO family protein